MPRVKLKRKSTFIDMTAMSDVTVLLLTFFMLTSTFVQKEPIQVATPSSVSEIKIPESNILQILISYDNKTDKARIFMSLDNQDDKKNVLQAMGKEYNVSFTQKEMDNFKLINSFGVPMNKMKEFLNLRTEDQDGMLLGVNGGIPIDSLNNQFRRWVYNSRVESQKRLNELKSTEKVKLKIAIKADQITPYPVIKEVMSSLQDVREDRYNLITSLKTVAAEDM